MPFRAAIAAGVKVVMSAHIALPGIDRGQVRPGTVVPEILTGILRDSLRFDGLVVTDALTMSGVAAAYGAEAGVRAFLAGADLLLQPADPAAAIDAMEAALARGEITPERLDRSVRRVLEIKKNLGLFRRRTVSLDSIPMIVGSAEFQAEARTMAARSIVMVKDVGGTIYGLRSAHPPLTVVTYAEEDNRTMGQTLVGELRAPGLPRHRRPALARERAGELRLGRASPRAKSGGRLRHRRPADRGARQHRPSAPPRRPDQRRSPYLADDSGLARQSVSDLRPARGRLLPHRLAREPGHRGGRRPGARGRGADHGASPHHHSPVVPPRLGSPAPGAMIRPLPFPDTP